MFNASGNLQARWRLLLTILSMLHLRAVVTIEAAWQWSKLYLPCFSQLAFLLLLSSKSIIASLCNGSPSLPFVDVATHAGVDIPGEFAAFPDRVMDVRSPEC